ncbi:MAG TPA: hypothetical protein VFO10_09570 [Oligoflexus sp.]|uniref:hypothetical protein n=1 Tax=Oligoflexus sp. TaxID=1971216 RepID=UPI002D808307|nr:hypothetical protein [Oligoflexus sp.]HET9237487.1 hypothetical protein [Oligoflexus sp.]
MTSNKYSQIASHALILTVFGCGKNDSKDLSLQERFEAIYGYTDCAEMTIGTALLQSTWIRVFHTYYGGYLDQKETTFLDEKCKTTFTSVNRWAEYQILDSSDQDSGELRLAIKTRRILTVTNENAPPEMIGIPKVNCNIEMAEDLRKEECKAYFSVRRYVTLRLTAEGLRTFKDIDSAGTTEETRSIELAPFTLGILDPID